MMIDDYPERDSVSPENLILIGTENGTKNVEISTVEKYIKDSMANLFPGISRLVPGSLDQTWIPSAQSDTAVPVKYQIINIPKSIIKSDGQYLAIIDAEFTVDMGASYEGTTNKLYYDFNVTPVLDDGKSTNIPGGVNIRNFLCEGVEKYSKPNRFRGRLYDKNVPYIFKTTLFASNSLEVQEESEEGIITMNQRIYLSLNTERTDLYFDSACRVKPRIKKAYLLGPISGPIFDASVSIAR